MSSERFMSAAEVAVLLHVSTMTIYRMIRAGRFPAYRVGGNYRVKHADVIAWLETARVEVSAT
jgi:excisionase family DNA binding protein